MDQHCPRGNYLVTISKSQVFSAWGPRDEPCLEKALSSNKPPYFSSSKNGNTSNKKAQKEKKKKKRCRDAEQAGKNTPTTGVYTSGTANKTHPWRKDPFQIICYNCNKKSHYADHYSKPWKNVSKN